VLDIASQATRPPLAPSAAVRAPARPAHTFRACTGPTDRAHLLCGVRTAPARVCGAQAECVTTAPSRRRRPAIVGARRYDPPVRRLTPATGVGNGGVRGHIGARGVGTAEGGRRGVAGPARPATGAARAHRRAVRRRRPRPAPPAAPAAHHRHGRLDVQRLLPVRLVDPLAAVVARARRRPALHHVPARPARRERHVEHPGARAGRALLADHAHRGTGRGLQRRDDPRPGRVGARARLALGSWVERWWPRAAAGLLYGFSPFVVAHSSVGHLNLVWAVLPPALLWLLHALLVAPHPGRGGPVCSSGWRSSCRPGVYTRPSRSALFCWS
jgi:hypothetical protein